MAKSETVIVGGSGISPGPNFTAGKVLQCVQEDPPLAGDTKITVIPAASAALTSEITIPGGTPNSMAIGEGVQINDALLTGSIAIGRTIVPVVGLNSGASGNQERIYIGLGFVCTKADDNKVFHRTVAIGPNIQLGPNDNSECVVMGQDARAGVTGNTNGCVAIGQGVRCNTGDNSVVIGSAAIQNGDNAVAIGRLARVGQASAVAVGRNARVDGTNGAIAIGRDALVSANQAMALGAFTTIAAGHTNSIALGRGAVTSASKQVAIGGTVSGGNDIADIQIGAGADAGNDTTGITRVAGSDIPNGSNKQGWSLAICAGRGSGNATDARVEFRTPTIEAAGSTAQTDVEQLRIMQSPGTVGNANMRISNVADHAAAAVGTLNNAPAAGDPLWVPIEVNFGAGAVLYAFPVWPV